MTLSIVLRRRAGALLLSAVTVFGAAGCGTSDGDGAGETLPAVDLVPLSGGAPVSLDAIDGPAVINLWATWCVPCRREIPDFEEVHRARSDEVRFVGINIGEDADQAASFLDEVGATYDQYLDPQGFAQTRLAAVSLPVTIVIDADGQVTTRRVGPMDQDDLDAAIDDALAG
jgi:cytochrome c biogenesis protein CcmG, thiol:disulfide interchange protein DsbE